MRLVPLAIALALSGSQLATVCAQEWWKSQRKPLSAADYSRFQNLGRTATSPDGRFVAWPLTTVYGDASVRVSRVGAEGREGDSMTLEHASRPQFSKDSRYLAFRIGVSAAAREKLEKAKKPVPAHLGVLDLASGERSKVEGVSGFGFSPNGLFLAIARRPAKGQKGGSDLLVRDLARSVDTVFGHVSAHAWADEGATLAMLLDAPERIGNSVQVYSPATGTLRTLDSAKARYRGLSWRRDALDLAVLRAIEPDDEKAKKGDEKSGVDGAEDSPKKDDKEEPAHVLLTWRSVDGDAPAAAVFDPREDENFPADHRIVSHARVTWAVAGDAVFFGIQPNPSVADLDSAAPGSLRAKLEAPAGVEVWHSGDIEIIPRQKKTLTQDRRRAHLCVWWLDDQAFVQLGDDLAETAAPIRQQRWAVGRDNTPYEDEKRFGPTVTDVYLINTKSGEKKKLLERNKFMYGSDPSGHFVAYVKDGHVWTYDIEGDVHRNLTEGVDGTFINDERKVLTDEHPSYGVAGWSEDGSRMFVYDRWDVWAFATTGTEAEQLTSGAEDRIRYRYVSMAIKPYRRDIIDPGEPMFLSVYGDRTKKSGYARRNPSGEIESLVWQDKLVAGLAKADKADVFTFTQQAFDDPPDVFVTDGGFASPVQLSDTDVIQKEFRWGRAELVDYENAHGEPMQGALFYPANYEPGVQYPLITYIYEMRSQNLHRWTAPSERSPYNPTVFTAAGYFVFQPDIVYRDQNPGLSALECVVPAVERVAARDDVDAKRIGLVGHSWGAYQTAFLVTHSDVFAAGVAGAPLTNMISMSMSVYWNSGQTDTWIFHESQGRMDKPFWHDLDTYVANSPIFGIENLKTPLLVAFGDEDGAVDWQQGVEFFNAARLAQKPVVMLVYPGENHGLRKKPNQVDYHHRVLEWFAHWLKEDPAPKWITDGQSWIDRQRELDAFKKRKKNGKKSERPPIGVDTTGGAQR